MLLIAAVLFFIALWLWLRLRYLRNTLSRLADAAESGKAFLYDIEADWGRRYHLERLSQIYNRMSAEREKSNRQEQSYLRQLEITLGNLTEAVIVVDNSGRLYLANPAARGLFGITGPLEGQKIESVIQSSKFLEFMRKIRYEENPGRGQIEMLSGRQTLFLEVAGARIPDSGDTSRDLTLFVLHDVSNLKRLEGVRKEFVANVSHELRTPVTIIKGYSDTLLEDFDQLTDADRKRFLEKIHKNVARLHLLLEDLLALSRLEWETESLYRQPASLKKIIGDAVENFQQRIGTGVAEVCLELDETSDEAMVDPVKISQVFQNLLDNTIRYAKGFDCLCISTRRDGDHLYITVQDNGCGIPEDDVEHIFERFYRVDKGRSRESGGTGLGLSIVKHIVQLHGGTVHAVSAPGEGTRIEIDIPYISPDDEPEDDSAQSRDATTQPA